jgi:hypothetical protein
MFGTYNESVRLLERLMSLYEKLPMGDRERQAALSALAAARAMILGAEEAAVKRCLYFMEANGLSTEKESWDWLPFDVRHLDSHLISQEGEEVN